MRIDTTKGVWTHIMSLNSVFQRWVKEKLKLTGGGLILQIPVLITTGRILVMYAMGSRNSSAVGWKTGASGGVIKSSMALPLFSVLFSTRFNSSCSVICSLYRDTLERVKGVQTAIFCESPALWWKTLGGDLRMRNKAVRKWASFGRKPKCSCLK